MLTLLSVISVLVHLCYGKGDFLNIFDFRIDDSIRNDPDFQNSTFASMADRRGFVLLSYDVVSCDNKFLLTLHRLMDKSQTEDDLVGRPIVFFLPPLGGTSQVYAMDNRDESIAYILFDAGFDVWLGNIRGNTYGHCRPNGEPLGNTYKDWNHHVYDYAVCDATAQIDFILSKAGQEKLRLVGMSQGTTTSLQLLALKPEYRAKIVAYASMASLLSLKHLKHPVARAFLEIFTPTPIVPIVVPQDVTPQGMFIIKGASDLCAAIVDAWGLRSDTALGNLILQGAADVGGLLLPENFCETIAGSLLPFGDLLDPKRIPIMLQFYPGGMSITDLNYFSTMMSMDTKRRITTFDYTKHQDPVSRLFHNLNEDHYGQKKPLIINLEDITTPMKFYYADEDYLAPPNETFDIISRLPNANVKMYRVSRKGYGHNNFLTCNKKMCGEENVLLYNDLADFLKQF